MVLDQIVNSRNNKDVVLVLQQLNNLHLGAFRCTYKIANTNAISNTVIQILAITIFIPVFFKLSIVV